MAEIKVFVVVDADGDYGIGVDADAAQEAYDADYTCAGPRRVLEITLQVPAPEAIQLSCVVPAEALPSVPVKMSVK